MPLPYNYVKPSEGLRGGIKAFRTIIGSVNLFINIYIPFFYILFFSFNIILKPCLPSS